MLGKKNRVIFQLPGASTVLIFLADLILAVTSIAAEGINLFVCKSFID